MKVEIQTVVDAILVIFAFVIVNSYFLPVDLVQIFKKVLLVKLENSKISDINRLGPGMKVLYF